MPVVLMRALENPQGSDVRRALLRVVPDSGPLAQWWLEGICPNALSSKPQTGPRAIVRPFQPPCSHRSWHLRGRR